MASNSESGKGAKRRTTLIPRVKVNCTENSLNTDGLNNRRISDNTENGKDSGLSSESSTPTGGSPPSRQQKIVVASATLSNSIVTNRGQNDPARIGSARTSRLLRSRTGTESPRSLDSVRTRKIASPFRPVLTGNGQTLSVDSSDEGSPRLEKCNYHQDIVYIKTGLLKLMRVIQESEEKDLTRAETLNPFSNSIMNGLFHNLNEEGITETGVPLTNGSLNVVDELTDLRRQVIFLEGQLEDKDRVIQQLQLQVSKQQELINSVDSQSGASSMYGSNLYSTKDVSNAATQTEKIRPVSAGPSLLQGFPQDSGMGPLVSWNETWNHQNSPSQRPSSLMESNCIIVNNKNNQKTNEVLHRPIIKSRQEQATSCLNGRTDKPIDSTTIRRIMKSREIVAAKVIDSNNFSKESSKTEISKSCIPSLKKVTTLTCIPRVTRADMLITGRSHNS